METVLLETTRAWTPFGLAAAGLALLLFGRKLFWLLVAVAGGLAAFVLVTRWLHMDPGWPSWVVSIVAGLGGALLAVALQRLAVGFVGFVAAVGLMFLVLDHGVAGLTYPEPVWMTVLLAIGAGILGALLAGFLFEVALVVLSAGIGALFVVRAVPQHMVSDGGALVLWAVLALVGVGVQTSMRRVREKD